MSAVAFVRGFTLVIAVVTAAGCGGTKDKIASLKSCWMKRGLTVMASASLTKRGTV